MPIGLDAEATRILADVGFLGVSRGRFDDARAVFDAIRRIHPDAEVGYVGLGIAMMGAGDARGASRLLAEGPQTEAALAFQCVALARLGDREAAQEVREDLEAMAPGSPLGELARAAVEAEG